MTDLGPIRAAPSEGAERAVACWPFRPGPLFRGIHRHEPRTIGRRTVAANRLRLKKYRNWYFSR